jgi:hypothetical protein
MDRKKKKKKKSAGEELLQLALQIITKEKQQLANLALLHGS